MGNPGISFQGTGNPRFTVFSFQSEGNPGISFQRGGNLGISFQGTGNPGFFLSGPRFFLSGAGFFLSAISGDFLSDPGNHESALLWGRVREGETEDALTRQQSPKGSADFSSRAAAPVLLSLFSPAEYPRI